MNEGALDTFALVINFLTLNWETKHVTIGLFKAKDIIGINLASQLQVLFEKYNLINKMICCVKDEGTNLSTMTSVLKQIVNYERLGILAPCEGVCFGHAISKTGQYATSDEKVSSSLQPVNIKFV
jgi:hypothetical protein